MLVDITVFRLNLLLLTASLLGQSSANEHLQQKRHSHAEVHKRFAEARQAQCTTDDVLSTLQMPSYSSAATSFCGQVIQLSTVTAGITTASTATKTSYKTLTTTATITMNRNLHILDRRPPNPVVPSSSIAKRDTPGGSVSVFPTATSRSPGAQRVDRRPPNWANVISQSSSSKSAGGSSSSSAGHSKRDASITSTIVVSTTITRSTGTHSSLHVLDRRPPNSKFGQRDVYGAQTVMEPFPYSTGMTDMAAQFTSACSCLSIPPVTVQTTVSAITTLTVSATKTKTIYHITHPVKSSSSTTATTSSSTASIAARDLEARSKSTSLSSSTPSSKPSSMSSSSSKSSSSSLPPTTIKPSSTTSPTSSATKKSTLTTPTQCLSSNLANLPVTQSHNSDLFSMDSSLSMYFPGNGTAMDSDVSCCALCYSMDNCYAYSFQNYDFWTKTSGPKTCQLFVAQPSQIATTCQQNGLIDVALCENTGGAPSKATQVIGWGPCNTGPPIGHGDSTCGA